jgi:peptide/nickel transport system ATP-binding protein/oligopeptide transport system ATP-binding protein
MTEPLLEVEDLRVRIPTARGTVHAVEGASFAVRPGEALGLVGESGSGKSMTLRAILGLLPTPGEIAGGSVRYAGRELVGLGHKELRALRGREIAMVFQEPMTALNPLTRVGHQIAEAPRVRFGMSARRARERALELLGLVGVPDARRRLEAYPHELSGGLRQRVMIAIALSGEPKLLLCDEPTTALDVTIQDQILKLLTRLREEQGLALVFVTHDLAVVAQTCERVAVMYAGRVLETGGVDQVFREPRHPYTLGLLRSVPDVALVRERLASIGGSPPDLAHPPVGCPFHPRCPFAEDDCLGPAAVELSPAGPGRATACIHPDRAAESVREEPVIAGA